MKARDPQGAQSLVVMVGVIVIAFFMLPTFLQHHSSTSLAWSWIPVLGGFVLVLRRRDFSSLVPLTALGAATVEFLDAAPWPVPAVQLPDMGTVCLVLHAALVGWVVAGSVRHRSLALTGAGVLVALLSFHRTFTEGPAPRSVMAAVTHGLAVWLLVWLLARRAPRGRGVVLAGAALLLLAAVLLPWAMRPAPTLRQMTGWLDALVLFLLLAYGGQAEGWERVWRMGLAVGGGVAFLGIVRVGLWWAGLGTSAAFGYRLKVGGLHENLVASLLAATGAMLVALARRRSSPLLWAASPVWIVALLLTYSRGGWLAAVAGLLVALSLGKVQRRWLLPAGVCVLLAGAALVGPVRKAVARRFLTVEEGFRGRKETWAATGRMIVERPLRGHGWAAGYARARYATSLASSKYLLSHAHNLPLEVTYSYGVGGLVLVVCVVAGALRGAGRRGELAAAGAGSVAALAVHGLVAQPLVCPAVVAVAVIGLSLGSSGTVRWRPSSPRWALLPCWMLVLWVGTAVPLLLGLGGFDVVRRRIVDPLEPDGWQAEAEALIRAGRPGEAVVWFQEALRYKREFPPFLTDLGWALHGAGQSREAAAAMRRAHELDPQGIHGGEHQTALAYMMLQQGHREQALQLLTSAVRREPYGFRRQPWMWRGLQEGKIDACLPRVVEASEGAFRKTGFCSGIRAQEVIERARRPERDDYLWLGSALHCLGRLNEAALVLEDGVRAKPADGALSFRLSEVYRESKRWREEALLNYRSGHPYREAEAWLGLGEWDRVVEAVKRDLRRKQYRLADDFWMMAQALWHLGRTAEVASWARKSLFSLYRPERAVQLASWLAQEGHEEKACAECRRALRHLVRDRNRRWGGWRWREKDHALRVASSFKALNDECRSTVKGRSDVELAVRSRLASGSDDEEAIRYAGEAAAHSPQDAWLWLNLAEVQAEAGRVWEAVQSIEQAVVVGADLLRALQRQGELLLSAGEAADAVATLVEGAALDEANGRWLVRIWEALAGLGYEEAAVVALRGAGQREKDWADSHILLADWWDDRGAREEAEAEHLKAVEADPYSTWARESYGRRLLAWSRPEEALVQLQVAANYEPTQPKLRYWLAHGHLAVRDTTAALEQLGKAISLDKSFTPAAQLRDSLLARRTTPAPWRRPLAGSDQDP